MLSFLKNSLVKNREKQILKKDTTGITLPKWPVLTGWGTWLIFEIGVLIIFKGLRSSFLC